MKMNIEVLKILERKLFEYSKENGAIAEHESSNMNHCLGCSGSCRGNCLAMCGDACGGSCRTTTYGRR